MRMELSPILKLDDPSLSHKIKPCNLNNRFTFPNTQKLSFDQNTERANASVHFDAKTRLVPVDINFPLK